MKKTIFLIIFLIFQNSFAQKIPYTGVDHLDTLIYYTNQDVREIKKNGKFGNYGFNNKDFENKIKKAGWYISAPWCAHTNSMILNLNKEKIIEPSYRGGLARNFITKKSISADKVRKGLVTIPKGSIVTWEKGKTPFGHSGENYEDWKGPFGKTIEGNTSSGVSGSQDNGDGLYPRGRTIAPRDYFRITNFTLVTYKPIDKQNDIKKELDKERFKQFIKEFINFYPISIY